MSTVMLVSALSGCTLVGAGVGAGIDSAVPGPYAERPLAERKRLEPGQRVILQWAGKRVEGVYVGAHGPTPRDPELYLLIDSEGGIASAPASEVTSVAIEVTGKGWLYGAIVGAAVDAAIVIVVVVALITFQPRFDASASETAWE